MCVCVCLCVCVCVCACECVCVHVCVHVCVCMCRAAVTLRLAHRGRTSVQVGGVDDRAGKEPRGRDHTAQHRRPRPCVRAVCRVCVFVFEFVVPNSRLPLAGRH